MSPCQLQVDVQHRTFGFWRKSTLKFVSPERASPELQDVLLCLEVGVTGFRLFMLEGFLIQ